MEEKTTELMGLTFQDPAMNNWVNSQTMNEVSSNLRENYQTIETTKYFFYSISIGIFSYLLSISDLDNFVKINLLISMFLILVLITIPRIDYLRKRRRELLSRQESIRKFCKSRGLPLPKGYQ